MSCGRISDRFRWLLLMMMPLLCCSCCCFRRSHRRRADHCMPPPVATLTATALDTRVRAQQPLPTLVSQEMQTAADHTADRCIQRNLSHCLGEVQLLPVLCCPSRSLPPSAPKGTTSPRLQQRLSLLRPSNCFHGKR